MTLPDASADVPRRLTGFSCWCHTLALAASLGWSGCAATPVAPSRPQVVDGSGAEPASDDAHRGTPQGSGAREVDPRARPSPLEIQRSTLDRVIAAGPGALLARVPVEPTFDSKRRFVGFRIIEIFEGSPAVARYGIRRGDVLIGINDQRIVTPDSLMAAFERLRGADILAIRVLRDGNAVDFAFPIVPAGQPATDSTED